MIDMRADIFYSRLLPPGGNIQIDFRNDIFQAGHPTKKVIERIRLRGAFPLVCGLVHSIVQAGYGSSFDGTVEKRSCISIGIYIALQIHVALEKMASKRLTIADTFETSDDAF